MKSYRIAAIDVHKKMLAVVVANVAGEGEYQFERRKFGSTPDELRRLAEWLVELEVEEVVMESTAQYWKPVWQRWSGTGSRRASSGRGRQISRAPCTCAKPSPTTDRVGARTISPTPNG